MPESIDETSSLETSLLETLSNYRNSFKEHETIEGNTDSDLLMEVFDITAEMKMENKQYWGRELGMCWQRIVRAVISHHCEDGFFPPTKYGDDEPFDVGLHQFAIDTKYRVGSGDAGTLKKFKQYGAMLIEDGLKPVQVILREDNLPAAITAIKSGGWQIFIGADAFDWIDEQTGGYRLDKWLEAKKGKFSLFDD